MTQTFFPESSGSRVARQSYEEVESDEDDELGLLTHLEQIINLKA